VSVAYNKLMALQADVEDRERSDEIEFEAIVEKGPEGVGLGLVVVEDLVRQRIVIRQVNDNILLRGLSAEAGGDILSQDALVGIDKDDCMHWPFSRIRARLNAFRLPVGGTVRLRLQRRLAAPEAGAGAGAGPGLDESREQSPCASPAPRRDSGRSEGEGGEGEGEERGREGGRHEEDDNIDINVVTATTTTAAATTTAASATPTPTPTPAAMAAMADDEAEATATATAPRETVGLEEYRKLYM
jgi:hypothetical protein